MSAYTEYEDVMVLMWKDDWLGNFDFANEDEVREWARVAVEDLPEYMVRRLVAKAKSGYSVE